MPRKIELTPRQIQKKAAGICVTPFCMRKKAKDRNICVQCRKEWYKKNHPIRFQYDVLRSNAKRRGKVFTLTYERFESLVKENDYMTKKGTRCKSLQIDRIDEDKGYTDDNVQCITLRENVYKYAAHKRKNSEPDPECPF